MSGVDPFPGEPRTAQERWIDANIRHQIGLSRVAGSIRTRVWHLLDATEEDLRREIRRRLRSYNRTTTPADVSRLRRLLEAIREIRSTSWRDVRDVWTEEMTAIAIEEPKFMAALMQTVLPVQVEPTLPPVNQLRAIVSSSPFEGRVLREWAEDVKRADIRRIEAQIQVGLVQGEDLPTISRRVVGSVSLRGTDGVTQITRQNAEAITRTAVNHIANQSRQQFFLENDDIVSREIFLATLDSRTTPVCRSYDGDIFELGVGPIPPLHFRCRSLRTALLDAEPLGERPMKPVTERMLLREFTDREGLPKVSSRDDLPRGTKGQFDSFARRRTRELIGRVPAKTTYQEWMRRQSAEFQDDVLGVTRGRLFRRGGLELKNFVDRTGTEIPLSRLARMHADAFRAAGLDPADFLVRS